MGYAREDELRPIAHPKRPHLVLGMVDALGSRDATGGPWMVDFYRREPFRAEATMASQSYIYTDRLQQSFGRGESPEGVGDTATRG